MNIYELIDKAEDLVDEAHNTADNEMFLDSRSLLLKLMSYLIDNLPKIKMETPPANGQEQPEGGTNPTHVQDLINEAIYQTYVAQEHAAAKSFVQAYARLRELCLYLSSHLPFDKNQKPLKPTTEITERNLPHEH